MPCKRYPRMAKAECGAVVRLEHGDVPICLVRAADGRFFAVSDACTHEPDASLSQGWVYGTEIECARHNSIFSLETGEALSMPACEPLLTFKVTVEGDDLLIDI